MHTSSQTTISRWLASELTLSRLISAFSAGLVAGTIHAIVPVSFAALIFSGRISGYVSQGIGLILLGSIGALFISILLSSHGGTLTVAQDAPSTVMAVISVGLMNTLPPSTPPQEVFLTVAAAMAASSLLTGLACFLLGQFRLGALMRYLPYPVVGGFLAGTGWLLVTGGVGMMSGEGVSLAGLTILFQPVTLLRWLPGLLLALGMMAALNRFNHFLVLPGMILGAGLLFFIIAWFTGASLNHLFTQGWLLGPLPAGGLWKPFSLNDLALVHWDHILAQGGGLLTIVLVSTVSLLLNVSGIELAVRHDIDLDRELKAVGFGNLISGVLGGSVNYHTLSTTVLNHRLGRDSRFTGCVVILICAVILFLGAAVLNFVPKMVLGSLLVLLGLSFLKEWVLQAWSRFPLVEYLIILLILVVIAVFGYLPGVAVGLLAAIALFVVNYSQINVIKHTLIGTEYHSRVTREIDQRRILQEQGGRILILQLQGYIFFGTANHLFDRICEQVKKAEQIEKHRLEYVILDFCQVSGLDSTATLSFEKIKQLARQQSFIVVLSSLSSRVRLIFDKAGMLQPEKDFRSYQDLDHAVEWCENRILASFQRAARGENLSLAAELQLILPDPQQVERLLHHLERQTLTAGAYLIRQGDDPDEIFFIESGQVTAQLEAPGQDPIRLETMRGGRVVGELGFYLGIPRTAAVIADEPSVVYKLSRSGLKQIEVEDCASSSVFHQLLANLLAERTTHLIDSVNALQRS